MSGADVLMATLEETSPQYLAGISMQFTLGQLVSVKAGNRGHIIGMHYDSESGAPVADIALVDPIPLRAIGDIPASLMYRTWSPLAELQPADEHAMIRYRLSSALLKAEQFITGFESDPLQEGIDDLLNEIRAAISLARA